MFTVLSTATPGTYTITVTDSSSGLASATFTVTGGQGTLTLKPNAGPSGTEVSITGGFVKNSGPDTSCSVSSPAGAIISNPACVTTNGGANFTGSFTVGAITPGEYVIEVTGCTGNNGCPPSVGDFVQAVFTVTAGPTILLLPSKGPTGTHVNFEGTGFLPDDNGCNVFNPQNIPNVVTDGACAQTYNSTGAFVNMTGSFNIGNVAPGQYLIRVQGVTDGDHADAIFNVTLGPALTLTPTKGPLGTSVEFSGTDFSPNDNGCNVFSPQNSGIVTGSACTLRSGQTTPTGSFLVGNVPAGEYLIRVQGVVTGDFADAVFNVTGGPKITLIPSTAPVGAHISVNGTGFLPSDTQCVIGAPSSAVIIGGTQACVMQAGKGIINASFTVNDVPPGQYVIQVQGVPGGDFAQALLNVTLGPRLTLSPGSGRTGAHITVNGTGFLPTDASCSVSSITTITTTATTTTTTTTVIAPGTAGCVLRLGSGVVEASFIIGDVFPGQYVIEVTGCAGNNGCAPSAGDFAQAVLYVVSGPSITLSPASGRTGAQILVNGTGFQPSDSLCVVVSPASNPINPILPGTAACIITEGSGNISASFTVANVPAGEYVIEVDAYTAVIVTTTVSSTTTVATTTTVSTTSTSTVSQEYAQAILNVVGGPSITLRPATGEAGESVLVNGTGFLPTDYSCVIGAPGSGAILGGTQACVITAGSGKVNASFTIGNVLPGEYVIQVNGNEGDFAQAVLAVTSGPSITLKPVTAEAGATIVVNGTGFLPTDNICAIGAPGSAVILGGTQACVIVVGTGDVNASFTIGNVLPGEYVIQVSGNGGDFAQAIITVTSGPAITLKPRVAEAGASIVVNGTGFLPTDNICAIGAPGSAVILGGTQACVITVGTGAINASFTIGNILPGEYVIQVTGNGGDFAQAIVSVTSGPAITLKPTTGLPGASIIVNGTGFLPTDTSCAIGAPGSGAILGGTQACVITVGTGAINASFTIGNVTPGEYVIQVTGNGGDSAQAILAVGNGGPRLSLVPTFGIIGQEITVNGTGFLPTDQSCSISGIGNGNLFNPILSGSAACAIAVGTGVVNGSLTIGAVAPGEYLIEVTGCTGNSGCAPSAGDFAEAVLRVIGNTAELDLFPTNATNGATVVVRAYGLSASDTGCVILSYSGDVTPVHQDDTLLTSPTCSIIAPQTAQGTFVVGPYATEDIHWNVTVKGTPTNDLLTNASQPFGVTASIVVTPTSGSINTVFTYTGSGFESDATKCTATVVPAITGSTSEPSCALSANTGQVSGSFLVPTTAIAGTYGIVVGDNTGSNATGIFTVGTPSALVVLNPASVEQGQAVGVAGTGFNAQDAYCTISSASGSALFDLTHPVTCLMASGYASGSFDVSPSAPGGYYLITVTGCSAAPTAQTTSAPPTCPTGDSLDFASNFLGVTLATTITTYSTTTSTASTTTSLSTTTTSVGTSFSYSSTTVQTTGIFFTTYSHFVLTTVSGVTSTTYSVTSYTTQTQTTVTYSTTTQFTTVPCGPLPCGFSTGPVPFNPAPGIDSVGLLAALLLLIPMLLRRLFT
jgi:hypothetical protein